MTEERFSLKGEMNIEYELNIDDLVAYNIYYFTNSPRIKRRMMVSKAIYLGGVLIIIILAITFLFIGRLSWLFIGFAAGYVIFVLLAANYHFKKSNIEKRIRKELTRRYGQGRNDIIGKHGLSITKEALKDSTEMDEHMIRWDVMEDVAETDQHLFIILHGLAEACIIPKRVFADEVGFQQFKKEAIEYHQAAKEAQ